jgi:leucine dehydrogenase
MPVFDSPDFDAHEQIVFCRDAASGLSAIIAIHNSNLGPALGGLRMWPYADSDAALADALRLSRGMTYKSAISGLSFGGGKAVIIGDPRKDKTPALFRAFGRFVDSLGGRYITAEDVGTSPRELEWVRQETRHVRGIAEGGAGDPSPATAHGVHGGIRAAVRHALGRESLDGVRVAVQGLGHVGEDVCRRLAADGAVLFVSDIRAETVGRVVDALGATAVTPEAIYDQAVDVFAPCALGAVINDDTVGRLRAKVIAGSANNQLAEARHGIALRQRGILYAPDYVINAGGVINIAHEGADYDREAAFAHVGRIYDTLLEIFARAERQGIATSEAADRIAEDRFLHSQQAHAAAE